MLNDHLWLINTSRLGKDVRYFAHGNTQLAETKSAGTLVGSAFGLVKIIFDFKLLHKTHIDLPHPEEAHTIPPVAQDRLFCE